MPDLGSDLGDIGREGAGRDDHAQLNSGNATSRARRARRDDGGSALRVGGEGCSVKARGGCGRRPVVTHRSCTGRPSDTTALNNARICSVIEAIDRVLSRH